METSWNMVCLVSLTTQTDKLTSQGKCINTRRWIQAWSLRIFTSFFFRERCESDSFHTAPNFLMWICMFVADNVLQDMLGLCKSWECNIMYFQRKFCSMHIKVSETVYDILWKVKRGCESGIKANKKRTLGNFINLGNLGQFGDGFNF